MKKLIPFLLLILICVLSNAQKPKGVVMKADTKPVIDGVRDAVYDLANKYNIDQPFVGNGATPQAPATIGAPGESTWEMLWDAEGFYVFLTVKDDEWYPYYKVRGANHWDYDKAEIYFDVNYVLEDGLGGTSYAAGGNQGHYVLAPAPMWAMIDGTPITANAGWIFAYKVGDPAWTCEYFVPFSMLTDKLGSPLDRTRILGFDVCICDKESSDPTPVTDNRKRAVWANTGLVNESYNNMDACGLITLDGVGDKVYIDGITLTGGAITEDNETLQIVATIEPADATTQTLKWSVESGTNKATIDEKGLLTGVLDGVVKVKAEAVDGSYKEAEVEVTISGQISTIWEFNLIKNGLFNDPGTAGQVPFWGGWIDGSRYGKTWRVENGVAVCEVMHSTDDWHYQFSQGGQFVALPDIPYILKFVAWADRDRNIGFTFEDDNNNYRRLGVSTDPESNGTSLWTLPITSTPTWYTFHVTFNQIVENTRQEIQFNLSGAVGTVFLDSILLISEVDYYEIIKNSEQRQSD